MKYRHLFIFLFLFLWIFIGFYLANVESPTWDEPIHLHAGKLFAAGEYGFDPMEPPLFRKIVYVFGSRIEQITGPSLTLFPYRAVVIISTGLSLCLLLWPLFSKSLFTGLLASVLLVYEPNLIAHGHYFTTDAISAIIAVYASLLILRERWKSKFQLLYLSLFFALALSLKVATLALLVPILLLKLHRFGKRNFIFLFIFCLIFIWSTYGFGSLPIFSHFDFHFPFGGYLRAIKENILFAMRGQPIYYHGAISLKAPFTKSFMTLLLKSTLPILIFAIWSVRKGKNTGSYLLIFLVVFITSTFKSLNFGMRHLLPAEIALVLLASQIKPKTMLNWIVFTMLIVWQISTFRNILPQTITYTNELSSKPNTRFSDSDFDWGQGLLWLRQEIISRRLSDFQFAYFGNVDPLLYLGRYTRIKDENPAASLKVEPLNYAKPIIISLTCYYQCGYYQDPYLKYRPREIIAQSFLYFP